MAGPTLFHGVEPARAASARKDVVKVTLDRVESCYNFYLLSRWWRWWELSREENSIWNVNEIHFCQFKGFILFQLGAFRDEKNAELIYMFHDLSHIIPPILWFFRGKLATIWLPNNNADRVSNVTVKLFGIFHCCFAFKLQIHAR